MVNPIPFDAPEDWFDSITSNVGTEQYEAPIRRTLLQSVSDALLAVGIVVAAGLVAGVFA